MGSTKNQGSFSDIEGENRYWETSPLSVITTCYVPGIILTAKDNILNRAFNQAKDRHLSK